jgi:hypothetical protein
MKQAGATAETANPAAKETATDMPPMKLRSPYNQLPPAVKPAPEVQPTQATPQPSILPPPSSPVLPGANTPIQPLPTVALFNPPVTTISSEPEAPRTWRVIGGADALLLHHAYNSNPAFTTTVATPFLGPGGSTVSQNFETDFGSTIMVAPRGWLGVEFESGLGIRARYFYYDETEAVNSGIPFTPGTTTTLTSALGLIALTGATTPPFQTAGPGPISATQHLFMHLGDLEVTETYRFNDRWRLVASGGVRFGYVDNRYVANVAGVTQTTTIGAVVVANSTINGTEAAEQIFYGFGPTVSLDLTRRLGDSHLSLVADVRGSVLYGNGQNMGGASVATTNNLTATTTTAVNTAQRSNLDVLPILEVELGAEWTHPLGNNATFFFRPTFVSQTYFNAANTILPPVYFTTPNAVGPRSGFFGLFGANLSLGVNF